MAELKDQKAADSLGTLPTAKEVMEQIAQKEAEKASAAVRELFSYGSGEKGIDRKIFKTLRCVR